MSLEPRLAELVARVRLARGEPTLLLLVVATDAVIEESQRAVVEILRATPMNVVEMGTATHETGPAQWVKSMGERPGDCHTFAAKLTGPFSQNAFANLVNAEREHLRGLTEPMLVFISRETESRLADRAPDFITWAAATYELPPVAELIAAANKISPAPSSSKRPEQQEIPLRFLHLSDFHLRPKLVRRFDQDRVLGGLIDFLERERSRFPLDAIFITGDLGFSGKADEYALVVEFFERLLEVTGVAPQRIFVVPGNHDVDRDVGKWLLRTLPDSETADAFFLEEGARDAHKRKFAAYLQSLAPLLGSSRQLGLGVGGEAIEMIDWHGARIAVGSFNSAWFAQGDDDRGKLWLGYANVNHAGDRIAEAGASFSIALMHHPFEHLDERDREQVEYRVERTFDLVMRGHMHNNRTRAIRTERGGYVEIAGPAAYQGSQWSNGCFFGELRPQAKTVRLIPYKYSRGMDPWVLDTSVFPDDAAEGHCPTYRVEKKKILPGIYRKAHERAANRAIKDLPEASKQALAKEFGFIAQSETKLSTAVAKKIERIAAAANEDEALWAKPEQAKNLEREIGEAVTEEALADMPEVIKISRNGPDFLEEALVKVAPVLLRKAQKLRSSKKTELRGLLCSLLAHVIDGPVSEWIGMGMMWRNGPLVSPDILVGTPNDDEFERGAVKIAAIPHMKFEISHLLDEFEQYLEETNTHNAAIVLFTEPGTQLAEPRHEHRKGSKGYDILITYLPIKLSQ